MLTRLKNWIQGSRQRKRDRWEPHRGHLSEQEKHVVDAGEVPPAYSTKSFDEQSRGKPRH
jgi:hypothetical protein